MTGMGVSSIQSGAGWNVPAGRHGSSRDDRSGGLIFRVVRPRTACSRTVHLRNVDSLGRTKVSGTELARKLGARWLRSLRLSRLASAGHFEYENDETLSAGLDW